jgi:hypothetical protein
LNFPVYLKEHLGLYMVVVFFLLLIIKIYHAIGKSGIHGFGIFAKHPHRAGDMVN